MAPNYRSLVPGGSFSSTPFDRSMRVSIRCNNPGAVNGAKWEKKYPGFVATVETTPGNKTTIFEAPEFGVAVWWELLRRYSEANTRTVKEIVTRYGGGQDYSNYVAYVEKKTGFKGSKEIDLADDTVLLAFGKAMFSYEAGQPTPLSDHQVVFGLQLGRVGGDVTKMPSPSIVTAQFASLTVSAADDSACVPQLIDFANSVEVLHEMQDIAAKSLKAAGLGYTLHNACAATLSAFLNKAGISVRTTLGAGKLADRLIERGWDKIDIGSQAAGDVGVARNNVHIYLVAEARGADAMLIADNQKPLPHTRSAAGKDGKTPTAYFLRASAARNNALFAFSLTDAPIDDGFYPFADEETDHLDDKD